MWQVGYCAYRDKNQVRSLNGQGKVSTSHLTSHMIRFHTFNWVSYQRIQNDMFSLYSSCRGKSSALYCAWKIMSFRILFTHARIETCFHLFLITFINLSSAQWNSSNMQDCNKLEHKLDWPFDAPHFVAFYSESTINAGLTQFEPDKKQTLSACKGKKKLCHRFTYQGRQ